MANEKISELPSASPNPTDALVIARAGTNYQVAASAVAALAGGIAVQPGGNVAGVTASVSSGTLTLAGGNNITLSQNGNAITISAASQIPSFSAGVFGGNTTGTTGITGSQLILAGGNNVTLSQSNNTAGASVTISAGAGFSAGLSNIGNTSGATGLTGTQLVLAGGNGITLSQGTNTAGATITVSASQTVQTQNVVDVTVGGNTTGTLALISSGTMFLAGGNNITLSQVGQSITISANTANPANLSVSAGLSTGTFGGITFSNGSGVSWGLNLGTITASVASQTVQTQNVVDVTLGGNTTGALALISSGTLFLAGGNNITLSQAGQSVTISANTVAAATLSVSAGTSSGALGGITLSNSNNVSFGLNNGTITASASQSAQTQASGAIAGTGFTSTTTAGSVLVGTLNTSGISLGVPAWLTTQSVQTQDMRAASLSGNTTGTLALISSGTIILAGGNNITLSQNGQSVTILANTAAAFSGGISNIGNTTGNTGITGTQLVLAGGNNITLSQVTGANGATVTVSAFTQTNQSLGLYASSQTYGQSSSSTVDARSLTIVGQGIMSVGLSGASLMLSATQSNQSIGFYASSQSTGQSSSSTIDARSLTFVGAGIISVGLSQGSVLISAPGSTGISQSIYVTGNTTQSSSGTASIGSLLVQGAGAISVGMTNGSLVVSGNSIAGAPVNFSAGTTSGNLGSVVFSNANGISFGLSGSTITASGGGGGGGGGVGLGVSTFGNTAGSTGTVTTGNVVLVGSGPISLSQSTGAAGSAATISIIAPATSSLIGVAGLSVSTIGSTIVVYANTLTRMIWPAAPQLTAVTAPGQGSISIQYVAPMWPVTATRLDALASWSGASSATTNTGAIVLSAYAAVYTRNAGTLSSLSSGSTQTTYTYASNSAGHTEFAQPAIRPISVPMNVSMTPGEYFVGFGFSTNSSSVGASTTNYGQTISMMGGNDLQTIANYAEIGAGTATSTNWFGGMGMFTAASAGIPASIALSNINQTGSALSAANIAIVFRNA